MKSKFFKAVRQNQDSFRLELGEDTILSLENYYQGVMKNNDLLHLVGKCDAKEFAIRHILESLYALRFLPEGSFFADIGTGAGLPGIPCLIARKDLKGILVESKQKKSEFLEKAVRLCDLTGRADVVNKQFDEARNPGVTHIMCRAIDGFAKKLPRIVNWSNSADLILFAGQNVKSALRKSKLEFEENLIPLSEQRFIYRVKRGNNLVAELPGENNTEETEPAAESDAPIFP
ncbi:MAG: RsmG family class I SAM-dependent methyltransferase [Pyrinomonadaceae bacterium]